MRAACALLCLSGFLLGHGTDTVLHVQPTEIQQKFDLQWAEGQINGVTEEAGAMSKQLGDGVSNLTSSAAVVHATDAVAGVANVTSAFAGDVEHRSKKAAYAAALVYLGKCQIFRAHVADVAPVLAPRLASSFQQSKSSPADPAVCAKQAAAAVDATISEQMTFTSEQERTVVTWIAEDQSSNICSSELLETLALFECIRITLPRQYEVAVTDRILLKVLTKQALSKELDALCSDAQASQLFSTGHELSAGKLQTSHGATLRATSVIAMLGCVLLFSISAVLRRRCVVLPRIDYAGVGRSSARADVSDVERGYFQGEEPLTISE